MSYSHSIWWIMPIEIVLEIFSSDNLFSLEVIRDKNQYQDTHLHQLILFSYYCRPATCSKLLFSKIFPFLKLSSSRWITSVFTTNKQPLRFFCNLKDGLKKIMACTCNNTYEGIVSNYDFMMNHGSSRKNQDWKIPQAEQAKQYFTSIVQGCQVNNLDYLASSHKKINILCTTYYTKYSFTTSYHSPFLLGMQQTLNVETLPWPKD